jgi:hypothetical protein
MYRPRRFPVGPRFEGGTIPVVPAPRPWPGGRPVVALVLVVAAMLAGCGVKHPPLPPVVRIADPTRDLAVFQEGSDAVLSWSYPASTTAGEPLPDLEAVEVWRLTMRHDEAPPPAQTPRDRNLNRQLILAGGERLVVLDETGLDTATRGSQLVWRDDLEAWHRDHPDEEPQMLWYAVRSVCCRGRESELSNIVRLVPEPPPPPPTGLELVPEAAGIRLTWVPHEDLPVVVERSSNGADWQEVGDHEQDSGGWLDPGASQGARWHYRLRSVSHSEGGVKVVGEPGPESEVDHPDVYPPLPPADLVCLPEGDRVRLRWQSVTEASTYRVARATDGGTPSVLADELASTQFDDEAPPGGNLTYEVTAADATGNRSQAAVCSAARGAAP